MKTASATAGQITAKPSSGFHKMLQELRANGYKGCQPTFFNDLPHIKKRSVIAELNRQQPKFNYSKTQVFYTKDLIKYKEAVQGLLFWERFEMDFPILIF
jgi:hypothetical protein